MKAHAEARIGTPLGRIEVEQAGHPLARRSDFSAVRGAYLKCGNDTDADPGIDGKPIYEYAPAIVKTQV